MDNGASSYRRFLEGDDTGFVEIIRDYKDGLILYLNGYVNNIYTAEELTEETFFKIVTRKPRFSGRSSFKTWLYAIGRNVAMDFLRHRSKYSETPIEEHEGYLNDMQSLESEYIKRERQRMLYNALGRIKKEHREVLWLIYFEGFSNKEAALILGKGRHRLDNLVYRAKRSLAAELEKEGFVYEEL